MHFSGYIILGWLLGSFCGAYVYRWPQGLSMLKPLRSFCPQCNATIPWYDNIPLLSFILLRGKSRCCGKPISWDYFWVELTSFVLYPIVIWNFRRSSVLVQVEWSVFFYLLLVQTFIDLKHRLIPDQVSLGGTLAGLAFSWAHEPAFVFFKLRLIGALTGFGFFWIVAKVYTWRTGREGLGMGDMKLLMMIGSFLTVWGIFYVVFLSSLIGLIAGMIVIFFKHGNMKSAIPFGPCIAAGALLVFLANVYNIFLIPHAL